MIFLHSYLRALDANAFTGPLWCCGDDGTCCCCCFTSTHPGYAGTTGWRQDHYSNVDLLNTMAVNPWTCYQILPLLHKLTLTWNSALSTLSFPYELETGQQLHEKFKGVTIASLKRKQSLPEICVDGSPFSKQNKAAVQVYFNWDKYKSELRYLYSLPVKEWNHSS